MFSNIGNYFQNYLKICIGRIIHYAILSDQSGMTTSNPLFPEKRCNMPLLGHIYQLPELIVHQDLEEVPSDGIATYYGNLRQQASQNK